MLEQGRILQLQGDKVQQGGRILLKFAAFPIIPEIASFPLPKDCAVLPALCTVDLRSDKHIQRLNYLRPHFLLNYTQVNLK